MLVQVVALLSLGVLCSSVPLQAARPTDSRREAQQEERTRALVGSMIREILQDMQKLNLSADPRVVTVNAKVERCMQSHLKTFASTLTTLKMPNNTIGVRLSAVDRKYKHIVPKDLDEECKTVEVTSDMFLDALESFLRLLSEKIQNA